MKGIFFSLLIGIGVVGAAVVVRQRGISLPTLRLPGRGEATAEPISNLPGDSQGDVLGSEAPPLAINHYADRLSGVGKVLGSVVSALGVQTVKTGETLVKNVTSTPSSSSEVIDVSTVVKDISSKIESIPSNLVNQAKIEYCRQVLETASASALAQ